MDIIPTMASLAKWSGIALVGGFIAVVFWQLLEGRISLDGLAERQISKRASTLGSSTLGASTLGSSTQRASTDVARLQMLVASLLIAVNYISQVIQSPGNALPAPSVWSLYLLGGSHLTFLGSKAYTQLFRPLLTGRGQVGTNAGKED